MRAFWLSLVLLAGPAGAESGAAGAAFARLQALAGRWQGTFEDGRTHTVDYRASAGGSVLVETWTLAPGRESLTLYHLDGERLLATHYCPQGTQPRLALQPGADPQRLDFAFVDGTSLQDPQRSHQHAFHVRFLDDGSFERAETYVANGAAAATDAAADPPVRYRRVD